MVDRQFFAGDIVQNRISGEQGEITVSDSPNKEAWVKITDGEAPGTFRWPFTTMMLVESAESRDAKRIEAARAGAKPEVVIETIDEKHFAEHAMDLGQALRDTVKRIEKELIDRHIMNVEPSLHIAVWLPNEHKTYELTFTVSDDEGLMVKSTDPEAAIQEFIRRVKWDYENDPDNSE